MPKMNRVDRALMGIDDMWAKQEEKAKVAESNQPAFGEEKFTLKRNARTAFAKTWASMTLEQRQQELSKPPEHPGQSATRGDEILDLMTKE